MSKIYGRDASYIIVDEVTTFLSPEQMDWRVFVDQKQRAYRDLVSCKAAAYQNTFKRAAQARKQLEEFQTFRAYRRLTK